MGVGTEQDEGGWRRGENVLGFVGAGSQGPQGGRWGMVRSEGILLCRLPLSDFIMPPHCGLAGVSQPGFLPSELCLCSALSAVC